eukprot:521057-Prymnesium_polylepis.1
MARGAGFELVVAADTTDYSDVLQGALIDCCAAALSPLPHSRALFATAARSEHCLDSFLRLLRANFVVTELSSSLQQLNDEDIRRAELKDDVRFFCATWVDAATAVRMRGSLGARDGSTAGAGEDRSPCEPPLKEAGEAVLPAVSMLDPDGRAVR